MIKKFICLLFFCSCIIVIPQTISSAEAYEINQKSAFKSEKPLAQLFGVMLGALSSTASNEQRRPIDDPIAYCQGNGRCFDHRGRVVVPENQNVPTYYDNRGGYNTQPVNAGYPSSGGRAVYCQNGRCFDDRGNVVSQGNQNMRVQQLRPSVQYTAPQSYPQRPAQRRQSYDKSELYCDMISGVCQLMATNEKITGTVKEYNEDNGTTFETYYLNGYPDTLKKYDKYGNLIKFIKLENNKITISQSYYPTGVIKTEEKWGYSGNPMNNPPLEEIIFYDEKGDMECHVSERLNCSLGEMISSCSSSSGKLVWKKISDEKNDVVSETIYRCGIKKRYVDGVLVEEVKGEISPENNSDNYVDAVVREYYAPDVLKSEERYKNNKKDGLAKYYDERGILIKAIKYKDGQADEQLAVYRDEKGHYGTEAEYEQAHYTGVLRRYNAAGKIEEENTYTNGILDGVCKLYYESGNLKAEMTFKNGKEAAPLKSYYETGELKSEIAFQNGTENGPAKYYTHSGALKIEMNFKDGKPEGVSKKYYDTGNLHLEANFVRGVENGSMKTYYETGGLQSDINFKDGVEDGPAKYYDEQGNLTKAVNYQNGQEGEILTIYQDDNGRYGVEPEYEQAHYTGTLKKYGADDVLESEKVYVGGLLNGLSKTYYKNGSIQTEVNFKNGVENGIAKYYDEEGNIMKAANYENGQVGDWLPIYQDDDGQYGTETEYMEAGYTGVLKKYGSDGKLESYKTYLNGVLDGLTQTYYETGQIKSKINFKNGKEDGIVKSYYQSGAIR